MHRIKAIPLTSKAFAPFGDVLDCTGDPDMLINQGFCNRFHDRAALKFEGGRAGISLFHAQPRQIPYTLELMERHPLCLLYTSPSPRDKRQSRMPSSA